MLSKVRTFFFAHWALYMLLSFIITGAIVSIYRIEQYLYLVNFLVVLSLINIANPIFNPHALNPKRYLKLLLGIFVFLAILSYIAIQTHGEIKGSHKRFGENQAMVDTVKK